MSTTGYVDFPTLPAGAGSTSVPNLGTFSALAGPVVGPDGTVFLASQEGRVTALHADGQPYWSGQMEENLGASAPPALGIDGSVYVVGWMRWVDHRPGHEGPGGRARLYRFLPGGVSAYGVEFPPTDDRGPAVLGAPEVWRVGEDEAILVPAIYHTLGGVNLRLLAFSTGGVLVGDWIRYLPYGPASESGSWEALGEAIGLGGFTPGVIPPAGEVAFPGVAIAPLSPQGGTPAVVLIDRFNRQTFTFRFCVGASCASAEAGLHELFSTPHAPHSLLSSPVTLPSRQTIIGASDGVVFTPPSEPLQQPPITGLGEVHATPTMAADGRVLVVNKYGELYGIKDGVVIAPLELQGRTIARPAASKSHVFVATTDYLYTLNATATSEITRFPWTAAGVWSPAVGPQGRVYAMAAHILFIFPGPTIYPGRGISLDEAPEVAMG